MIGGVGSSFEIEPVLAANTAACRTSHWIWKTSTSKHIIARKHRGQDESNNLAWACIFCNLYKGPNLASFDPDTGELTRLFNPRGDTWDEHFRMETFHIIGQTPIGRTTVWLLEMNSNILTRLRASLMRENRW